MIIREEDARKDTVLQVAKEMMTAARTAPKARGIDNIEVCVVGSSVLNELSREMRAVGEAKGLAFFLRDANNIDASECVVLIGARKGDMQLNCGLCGYPSCESKKDSHPETPCSFVDINLGIAIGSAVSIAADHRVDNRVLYSAGAVAKSVGLLLDCHAIMAIPLSCTSKSPYFDRQ